MCRGTLQAYSTHRDIRNEPTTLVQRQKEDHLADADIDRRRSVCRL